MLAHPYLLLMLPQQLLSNCVAVFGNNPNQAIDILRMAYLAGTQKAPELPKVLRDWLQGGTPRAFATAQAEEHGRKKR